MKKYQITKGCARRFILSYQGLYPPRKLKGKSDIISFIKKVGCIQFDPLDIVGHNHELVLQARVSGFQPVMLQELLYVDRRLLDGWDKMMSIYSVDDWPYFKRYREQNLRELGSPDKPVAAFLPQIRSELLQRGPLSSIELGFDETVDWPWAPTRLARAALESMYFWGELIIHHKVHTRKVYDFAERHLPHQLLAAPDPNITAEQYRDWHVLRRIGGTGLLWGKSGDAWLGIPGVKAVERMESIERLLVGGLLAEVGVEGMDTPLYIRNADLPLLEKVSGMFAHAGESSGPPAPKPRASVIAPLDNLLWDRRLVKELFDFDYRWEVYKPAAERKYGYYVLPVLYGDRFIARFEPGWDSKDKSVLIKNWWWEPGVKPKKAMKNELTKCFRDFAGFLGAAQVKTEAENVDFL